MQKQILVLYVRWAKRTVCICFSIVVMCIGYDLGLLDCGVCTIWVLGRFLSFDVWCHMLEEGTKLTI